MKVKPLLLGDIQSSLRHAYRVVKRMEKEDAEWHALQGAVSQVRQAHTELAKILGALEVERIFEGKK